MIGRQGQRQSGWRVAAGRRASAAGHVGLVVRLQVALGKIRRASGHFSGKLLAIDPHRVQSHSRRQMRQRVERAGNKPVKMAQTFWVLDADTCQPVCFTTATAARSVVEATPALMDLAEQILQPAAAQTLVVADAEHFSSVGTWKSSSTPTRRWAGTAPGR